ncbi:Gfo/Idh/MocA family protein [Petrachloros mirabilis]
MENRSQPELRIGLVGVGRHGSRYVHHLLHDLPGVSLAAICRKRVDERPPDSTISAYSDYRAMIADPLVQAVVVVTPPSLCREICLQAVSARKPILIEKPLATTGMDARVMVDAAAEAGVLLMTAQTMRFDPAILLLKKQLEYIGRLQSATLVSHIETKPNLLTDAAQPVALGALLELGVHLLDLVRFLTGDEIIKVRCTMTPPPSTAPETKVTVQLRTSRDVTCVLDIARVESERVGRAEWTGAVGTVTADWIHRTITRTMGQGTSEQWTVEPSPTVLATLKAFVRAIHTGTTPPITGVDGCRAVEAADACYRSAKLGGVWVDLASPR